MESIAVQTEPTLKFIPRSLKCQIAEGIRESSVVVYRLARVF